MKKSELKASIKEEIIEILSEAETADDISDKAKAQAELNKELERTKELTTEEGKDVYISVMKGKETGRFPTLGDLKMHQQEIIRTFMKPLTDDVTFESLEESVGQPITEAEFDRLAEKKDACYHKVKSRYKVWPSAYASGALVQCRKKGAANWGNKSKK